MCDVEEVRAKSFAERAHQFQGGEPPRVYTEVEKMLDAEELSGADICTPHSHHHITAIPCLEAKVDVIIEKPFAVSIKAGKKIIETAERNNCIVATAEQVRRGLTERTMYWAINKEKLIGEPRFFFSESASFGLGVGTPWRLQKMTGGGWLVIDGGVHYTDLLRYLFGDVERIYAQTRTYEKTRYRDVQNRTGEVDVTVEDTSTATLTFENGLIGVWTLTNALPGKGFGHTIYYGSEGSLDAQGVQRKDSTILSMHQLQEQYMNSLGPEEKEKLFPKGITNGVTIEVYDFLQAVKNRSKPEVSGWEGLKALTICDAIYESSWCGQAVLVKDVLEGKIEGYQQEINQCWGL
jgi:predicted dehydrogenase